MTALAPPRQRRPAPAGTLRWVAAPAGLALLSAAGVVAVYAVFVRTRPGQVVDELAMRGADVDHVRLVNLLSSTLDGTSLFSVAVVALLAAAIGLSRGRVDLAVAAGVLVVGANVTTQLLKQVLIRPVLHEAAPNSLPSGHTTAAASVAVALVMVLPHAVRAVATLAGAGYVAVIAVATVWAGWHRPSDVIAALLVVLAWGAGALAVVRAGRGGRVGDDRAPSRLAAFPLTAVRLVGGAIAVPGLACVALGVRGWPVLASDTVAFLAGSAGMCAAAATVFLVWLRLVSGDAAPGRAGRASGAEPVPLARRGGLAFGHRGIRCPSGEVTDEHTVNASR